MSTYEGAESSLRRIEDMERKAQRSLTAIQRAMGDDSHYYVRSLNHYTEWLIERGLLDQNHVDTYLDEMRPKAVVSKLMRRARKRLSEVTGKGL